MNLKNLFFLALLGCGSSSLLETRITPETRIFGEFSQPSDLQIDFTQRVSNYLVYSFGNQTREIPLCIVGEQDGKKYRVNDLPFPLISHSTRFSANFRECDIKNYLGMFHNHIDGDCSPSEIDLLRFAIDERAKIELILCGVYLSDGSTPNYARIKTIYKDLIPKDSLETLKKALTEKLFNPK